MDNKQGSGPVTLAAKWKIPLPLSRSLIPAVISILTMSIYLWPHTRHESGDTIPTRLIPILLLTQGDLNFDNYLPALQRKLPQLKGHLYFVKKVDNHYVSFFPVTPGLLLTPFYAPFVLYEKAADPVPDDWLQFADRAERLAAAIVATLSVLILYVILLCLGTNVIAAIALSVAYAFGTNAFATFAQHLWQHGLTALFSQLAILSALIYLRERARWHFITTGFLLGLAVACRPTSIVILIAILIWLVTERRDSVVPLLIAAAVILLPLASYNYYTYGNFFGGYRVFIPSRPNSLTAGSALLAMLVSPGRGLFFYFPLGMMAIWGPYVALKQRDKWSSFYTLLALIAAGHFCLIWIVRWNDWTGGHCWGPRYLSEIEFALIILLVPALQYSREIFTPTLAAVLAIVSIFMQAIGVYAMSDWNSSPVDISKMPARAWSFRDNPVSRALSPQLRSNRSVEYQMFQSKPVRVSAAKPPRRVHLPDGQALLVHAPSEMEFDIPMAATEVSGRFGFVPGAYQNGGRTKGAEFSIVLTNGQERVEIYKRFLNPVEVETDRGLQDFHVSLRGTTGGRLLFQTSPGPSKDASWGWTVWTGIEITRSPTAPKSD